MTRPIIVADGPNAGQVITYNTTTPIVDYEQGAEYEAWKKWFNEAYLKRGDC